MSNEAMTDDRTLVSRVLAGDRQAFMVLIRQHERLVAHMIGRLVKSQEDREALAQDVFLRVHERLGEFGFQSKLSTWIATIAYRQAINHLRKRKMFFTAIPDDESFADSFTYAAQTETGPADGGAGRDVAVSLRGTTPGTPTVSDSKGEE